MINRALLQKPRLRVTGNHSHGICPIELLFFSVFFRRARLPDGSLPFSLRWEIKQWRINKRRYDEVRTNANSLQWYIMGNAFGGIGLGTL